MNINKFLQEFFNELPDHIFDCKREVYVEIYENVFTAAVLSSVGDLYPYLAYRQGSMRGDLRRDVLVKLTKSGQLKSDDYDSMIDMVIRSEKFEPDSDRKNYVSFNDNGELENRTAFPYIERNVFTGMYYLKKVSDRTYYKLVNYIYDNEISGPHRSLVVNLIAFYGENDLVRSEKVKEALFFNLENSDGRDDRVDSAYAIVKNLSFSKTDFEKLYALYEKESESWTKGQLLIALAQGLKKYENLKVSHTILFYLSTRTEGDMLEASARALKYTGSDFMIQNFSVISSALHAKSRPLFVSYLFQSLLSVRPEHMNKVVEFFLSFGPRLKSSLGRGFIVSNIDGAKLSTLSGKSMTLIVRVYLMDFVKNYESRYIIDVIRILNRNQNFINDEVKSEIKLVLKYDATRNVSALNKEQREELSQLL